MNLAKIQIIDFINIVSKNVIAFVTFLNSESIHWLKMFIPINRS